MGKHILIIGSKPQPTFPDEPSDVVILVNGAVGYSPQFHENSIVIGFLSLDAVSPKRVSTQADRLYVSNVKVDKLIHWSPPNRKFLDSVPFYYENEQELTVHQLRKLAYSHLSTKFFLKNNLLLWNKKNIERCLSFCLGRQRYLLGSRLSSGMMAVVYAISNFQEAQKISVSGIGVRWSKGHSYNLDHKNNNFHEQADCEAFRMIKNRYGNLVSFYDLIKS